MTLALEQRAVDLTLRLAERLRALDPADPILAEVETYDAATYPALMPDGSVRVPLTKGKFTYIDEADYPMVSQRKWHAASSDGCWYAWARFGGKQESMHRFLIGAIPKGMVVDHKDWDGLNNRRSNLRLATHGQNTHNRKHNSRKIDSDPAKSRYRGVFFYPYWTNPNLKKKWRAIIKSHGKNYNLGYYDTEEEAALAYNKKAIELHGEFAVLNVILEGIRAEDLANAA